MSDEKSSKTKHAGLRRGIFLLPNLFTTGALFAGFFAIIVAMKGQYETAAVAIFLAMLLDGLDGRVARLTNTQSAFGAEYDSLSDMVSFGVAPALVAYQWSLVSLADYGPAWSKIGWLTAFVYTTSAALRLARFNTQIGIADKRYFQGLPSPAAAAVVMGLIWVCETYAIPGVDVVFIALPITLAAGALMVSRFSFYSFKDLDLRKRVPFVAVLIVMLIFVFLSIEPPTVLFAIFLVYMLHGPLLAITRRSRKRQKPGTD